MQSPRIHLIVTVLTVVLVSACKQSPQGRTIAAPLDQSSVYPGSVVFDIVPGQRPAGSGDAIAWLATYSSEGKTAIFKIELTITSRDAHAEFPMSFGNGRFIAQPGSDATVLLRNLRKALEAKIAPKNIKRIATLPFEFAILGEHQSRARDGGFSDKPRGDWMAMKIFLGEGDGEGEVFLNFNPVSGKAEFSIKDSDYGDVVLKELAKVL